MDKMTINEVIKQLEQIRTDIGDVRTDVTTLTGTVMSLSEIVRTLSVTVEKLKAFEKVTGDIDKLTRYIMGDAIDGKKISQGALDKVEEMWGFYVMVKTTRTILISIIGIIGVSGVLSVVNLVAEILKK
jgi:hypothetical protein